MRHHDDARWMARAVEIARQARGSTAPNPAVGAVLVRGGEVLGEGATRPAGQEHAEVVALEAARAAGRDPRGATAYVTLEPCCHHGRTPPCTDALLDAGIVRVVVGTVDPFERVRGQGLAQLRVAGVEVEVGVEREACELQILGFARAVSSGLPEVSCKAAVSADGHLASVTGASKWITGPEARMDGHRERAAHDAVLVGIGTVLADDPALTVRLPDLLPPRRPVPVVLDTHLRIPAASRVFAHPRRPIVICGPDAPERDLPAQVVRVPLDDRGRVDVEAALRALVKAGLHRVLVEGGAAVHRSLLERGLCDTVLLYVSGLVLPGGRGWVGGPPVAELEGATRMRLAEVRAIGPDARLTWRLDHAVSPDPLAGHRAYAG